MEKNLIENMAQRLWHAMPESAEGQRAVARVVVGYYKNQAKGDKGKGDK